MGKITDLIEKIMSEENLTLAEVFKIHPHLMEMQKNEMWEEYQGKNLTESKKKDLLLD